MDTIKFIIEDYVDTENGFRFPTINIYINERNLIDLVEEVEHERYSEEVAETSTRCYVGLHPEYYRGFLNEFLGKPMHAFSILLICTCLVAECNCITAKIIVNTDTVTWSELRSPFLSSETPNPWITVEEAIAMDWCPIDYSVLGDFVFDRDQYMDALKELRRNLDS